MLSETSSGGEVSRLGRNHNDSTSAIYTLTQVPGGEAGALRLTLISVLISMGALLASELLASRLGRRLGQDSGRG